MSSSPGPDAPSFIKESESGVILSIQLKPRSGRDSIEGPSPEGLLKIRVTAPPVKGAANESLIRLLSKSTGIPKSRIIIVSGETSTRKKVLVRDFNPESARQWFRDLEEKKKKK